MSGEIKEYEIYFRSKIYINAESQEEAEQILLGYDPQTLSNLSEFFDIESFEETGVKLDKTLENDEVEKLLQAFEVVRKSFYLTKLFKEKYGTDFEVIKLLIKNKTIKLEAKNFIYKLVEMTKI